MLRIAVRQMPRNDVREETQRLVEVTARLREVLAGRQAKFETVLSELDQGVPVGDMMIHGGAPDLREELDRALEEFHAQRYRWRVSLMRATLAEGMTITRFADLYGFSRQYAQRIAKEVQGKGRP